MGLSGRWWLRRELGSVRSRGSWVQIQSEAEKCPELLSKWPLLWLEESKFSDFLVKRFHSMGTMDKGFCQEEEARVVTLVPLKQELQH